MPSFFLSWVKKLLFAWCAIGLAFLWFPAQAQITVVETPRVTIVSMDGLSSTTWRGLRFRVGPQSVRISEFTAAVSPVTVGVPTNLTISLFALDAGPDYLPMGPALARTTFPFDPAVTTWTSAILDAVATTPLVANTAYALVVNGAVDWDQNGTDGVNSFINGFNSVGNGLAVRTTDGGGSWLSSPGYPVADLKVILATAPATASAIPSLNALALGTLTLAMLALNGFYLQRRRD